MANYDLTYEGSRVQGILDTGDELRDAGYIFRGEATPSTVPGTPTERVAYIGGPGTYTNFGSSTVVPSGSIGIFKYTGSAWSSEVIACTVPISTTVQNNDTTVPTGKAVKTAVDAVSGAVSDEATAREEADGALGTRIDDEATARGNADTALQNAINTINTKLAEGYVYVGIATATTNPGTPAGKVLYIATTAGTYTNFGNIVVTQGINILKYNGSTWLLDSFWGIDDAPIQGSDNLVKSGGVLNSIIQNGPAFDLSAYNAQGGVLATYADLSAALTALNALPADFKKGGMSMKYVQTSDNKYVQYRCIANEFTTDTNKWSICDEGVYIENSEWIDVVTDNEDKILYGVKTDGKFYFGDGCPPQVIEYITNILGSYDASDYADIKTFLGDLIDGDTLAALLNTKLDAEGLDADALNSMRTIDSAGYIEATTDAEDKILEGITSKGRKQINIPVELQSANIEQIENSEWIEVTTDNEDKILEGITSDGKKRISDFDEETTAIIGNIGNRSHFSIPQLDSNFISPIQCKIYNGDIEDESVKGLDSAKYVFKLSGLGDSFNIRVKFKINENLINQNKTGQIVKCGNISIYAIPTPLTQHTSEVSYQGTTKTMLWPQLDGGINICNNIESLLQYNNLGDIAFSIKYTGSDSYASVENDGTQLIVKSGADSSTAISTTFSFTTYETVSSLYEALKVLNDFEVYFKEVEGRATDELAIFSECQIKTTCYTAINGQPNGSIVEYVDNAPLFIPYAIDKKWHQVEIVKLGDKIYRVCDGNTIVLDYHSYVDYSVLTLGGNCLVQFKDLEISQNSPLDAELWENGGLIVSKVNPFITIFEGHSMVDKTTEEALNDGDDTITTTVDRLYRVFTTMISKGYTPVSLYDISDFYSSNGELPKKCFTIIFDDYEYANCLNADFRRVFKDLNIKPSLAIISDSNNVITLNGETITKKDAGEICWKNNFYLVTHTRNHRAVTSVKLSDIIDEFKQDIYSADKYLIDGMILVYPYGATNRYIMSSLQFLGYALAVNVAEDDSLYRSNVRSSNKYNLLRVEIGIRSSLTTILSKII